MSPLKKGVSKWAFREKLFGICTLMPTTTSMTPLDVIEPIFRVLSVSASDTIDIEALISSADNTPLDTPSEGILVTSATPYGSNIMKFGKCNHVFSFRIGITILYWFFYVCRLYSIEKSRSSSYFDVSFFSFLILIPLLAWPISLFMVIWFMKKE